MNLVCMNINWLGIELEEILNHLLDFLKLILISYAFFIEDIIENELLIMHMPIKVKANLKLILCIKSDLDFS